MAALAIAIGVMLDVRGLFLLKFPGDDELSRWWIFFERILFGEIVLSYFLYKGSFYFLTKIFYRTIIS